MLYDSKRKKETPGGWENLYDRWSNIHPTTQEQWNEQKFIEGLPIVGGWYGDWMRSKSYNERNAYLRDRYGITDTSPQYPWLSDYGSSNPDVRFAGNVGMATGAGAIMRLYQDERKKYRPQKKASWSGYGYQ